MDTHSSRRRHWNKTNTRSGTSTSSAESDNHVERSECMNESSDVVDRSECAVESSSIVDQNECTVESSTPLDVDVNIENSGLQLEAFCDRVVTSISQGGFMATSPSISGSGADFTGTSYP